MANENEKTTQPVQAGNFTALRPEFGRAAQIEQLFGIKRGTLYHLLSLGLIKGVLVRSKGKKSGLRLFDVDSVRNYILSCAQH
jgi:hypothetical protein